MRPNVFYPIVDSVRFLWSERVWCWISTKSIDKIIKPCERWQENKEIQTDLFHTLQCSGPRRQFILPQCEETITVMGQNDLFSILLQILQMSTLFPAAIKQWFLFVPLSYWMALRMVSWVWSGRVAMFWRLFANKTVWIRSSKTVNALAREAVEVPISTVFIKSGMVEMQKRGGHVYFVDILCSLYNTQKIYKTTTGT